MQLGNNPLNLINTHPGHKWGQGGEKPVLSMAMEQKEIKAAGAGSWKLAVQLGSRNLLRDSLESLDQGRIRNEQIIQYFKGQNI